MITPLFLALVLGAPSELESETRSYDLRLATPIVDEEEARTVLCPGLWFERGQRGLGQARYGRDADTAVTILYELFQSEFEYEGRWIDHVSDHVLLVHAPAPVHAEIERVLAFLERTFERAVELDLHVVDLPPGVGPPPADVAPRISRTRLRELIELARAGGHHEALSLRVPSGRGQTVDATRDLALVTSFDIEIAEKAVAGDPAVEFVSVGTRATVRAARRPGGARVLLGLEGTRQIGGVRELDVPGRTQLLAETQLVFGDLGERTQSLDVANRSLALTTFVPDDAVVALPLVDRRAGRGGGRWIFLALRGSAGERVESLVVGERTLQVLDLGELAGVGGFERNDGPSYDRPWRWERRVEACPELGEQEIAVAVDLKGPDLGAMHDLVMRGDDDWMLSIGAWNVTAREEPLAFAGSERFVSSDEVHDLDLQLRSGDEPIAALRLSVLDGTESIAVVAAETFVHGDVDVEVAQSSAAYDPEPVHVFDGAVVCVRPTRARDGRLVVEVALRARLLEAIERFDTRSALIGWMDQARHRNLFASERLVFDGTRAVGVVGDVGDGVRLEVRGVR